MNDYFIHRPLKPSIHATKMSLTPHQQFFPMFGFSTINENLQSTTRLKNKQKMKLTQIKNETKEQYKTEYTEIDDINSCTEIANSNKIKSILWSILEGKISLELVEKYLRDFQDKDTTDYRRLLCAYEYKKYS